MVMNLYIEQILLLISLWVVVLVSFFKFFQAGVSIYQEWDLTEQQIMGHETIISLKPTIDRALEAQKLEQANKSYDKKNLSNRASSLADKVFPQRDYRELETDERERYSQHKVRIKFDRATYENVNEFADFKTREQIEAHIHPVLHCFQKIEDMPCPTVVLIDGVCVGGGLELALACRWRIADLSAQLGLPEVILGVVPGSGGTQRLPALVGIVDALDMMLTGKNIRAKKPRSWG